MDASARREARKGWRGQIFRTWEEADAFDVLFWDRIPVEERARVTWELSRELYAIANPGADDEPRLSRSVARICRR